MSTPALSGPPPPRPRACERGIAVGRRAAGPNDAITDVAGVRVGHVTLWQDGVDGAVRTGVTAVVPDALADLFARPCTAGTAVLNGAGELTASVQVAEWGLLETPVVLTNTMGVGRAYDGVVAAMIAAVPAVGRDDVVIPTVGECDDSFLNDARVGLPGADDARRAVEEASERAPASGAVGAGTGMVAFGCKGGVGTASRLTDGLTVGALALVNFGGLEELTIAGVPVGVTLAAEGFEPAGAPRAGSCIVLLATDAPLTAAQCTRLARRAGLGLARTGSVAHHGSGEIFLAFSTTARHPRDEATEIAPSRRSDRALDGLFAATVEATEAAVVDCLFAADAVTGRDGNRAPALPVDRVLELLAAAGTASG